MEQNYKIVIQYEGTRYSGWQKQISTDNTIQGKIEAILSKMCDKSVEIQGAGRTDAGVHARAQVASFSMDTSFSTEEILHYLNQYLPEDIAVVSIERAPIRFHARLNAKGKHYRYRVRNASVPDVFTRRYVYQLPGFLNMEKMQQAAEILSGKHDFKAFTSNKRMKKSTVRTIAILLERKEDEIVFDFTGDGFLQHMVRILTGTLLAVGRGEKSIEEVKALFEGKERKDAGATVPASGLTLLEVFY